MPPIPTTSASCSETSGDAARHHLAFRGGSWRRCRMRTRWFLFSRQLPRVAGTCRFLAKCLNGCRARTGMAEAHNNLALVLGKLASRTRAGVDQKTAANPNLAAARSNLAPSYRAAVLWTRREAMLREAVRSDLASPDARTNHGAVLDAPAPFAEVEDEFQVLRPVRALRRRFQLRPDAATH